MYVAYSDLAVFFIVLFCLKRVNLIGNFLKSFNGKSRFLYKTVLRKSETNASNYLIRNMF